MANLAVIPLELNFIHELLGDRETQYRQAFWLKSEFKSDVWECNFGKYKKKIDFRATLPNSNYLTDSKHETLLDTFKCFLCVQTHPDATGGKKLNSNTARSVVNNAIKLIDYLLLNAEHYQLHKYSLDSLTESELTAILLKIGSCNETHQSIYRWRERLSQFLKEQIKGLEPDTITGILIKFPMLENNGFHANKCVLDLTNEERVYARVWIHLNGLYHHTIKQHQDAFHKTPNTAKLAALIYANTIGGKDSNLPQFPELGIEPVTYTSREHHAVTVRPKDAERRIGKKDFMLYCRVLRHLGLLQNIGLPVPAQALKATKQQRLMELSNLKPMGRFRTLPSHVVFSSLRQAIEFSMTYGKALIDSYLAVAVAANAAGKSLFKWQHDNMDITPYLTPSIQALGVKRWLIQELDDTKFSEKLNNIKYYSELRDNKGLWELLRVLYGAVQIVVGTLMARRQGELIDLIATKCLDTSKCHLVFFARKSGYDGKREKIVRPIPIVAADLILLLERLQMGLKENGIIDKYHSLFSYPQSRVQGLTNIDFRQFNDSFDYFCDYIKTPLTRDGDRYYIRQHQLRRFFAMLFFWGSSFGGMDTLRWFLSHTDVEHLYHYITESIPGSVLRGAQAHYATEQVQAYNENAYALADILEQRFGTRKFDLMDTNELDEYIENLIEEGRVTVKPEFFEAEDKKAYRILIKVSEKV